MSVLCLIDDYLIIHTTDYLLFNYNKDTKNPSEKQRNSSEKQVDSAVLLPLHPSQEEVETCEEYSIFTLYLSPTWDFKQELLSRADQLEVLAPASLREWMREMIGKMMKRYE